MPELDLRKLACPQPIIKCRDYLENNKVNTLDVLVDNQTAVENVSRFLRGQNYDISVAKESDSCWRIRAVSGEKNVGILEPEYFDDQAETFINEQLEKSEYSDPKFQILVLISTETLGEGDTELGTVLMKGFLETLPEMWPALWRIVLLNGGVKLACTPGPAMEALKVLQSTGVSIFVCGTCLNHYGLTEAKKVGEVSNMLDIVTSMQLAQKVIRP